MITQEVRAYMAELGRKGSANRNRNLSPERKKEIAAMGGRANLGVKKSKKKI